MGNSRKKDPKQKIKKIAEYVDVSPPSSAGRFYQIHPKNYVIHKRNMFCQDIFRH